MGSKPFRSLTQLVTPESPFLLRGYSQSTEDRDFELPNIPGEGVATADGIHEKMLN